MFLLAFGGPCEERSIARMLLFGVVLPLVMMLLWIASALWR
jgi:hypothetical protein